MGMNRLQLEACVHPFFDELRDPNCRLPNGRPLPPLFNFKPQGGSSVLVQRKVLDDENAVCPLLARLVSVVQGQHFVVSSVAPVN